MRESSIGLVLSIAHLPGHDSPESYGVGGPWLCGLFADRAVGEGDRGDEAAGDDATVGSSHSSAALPLAHDDPDPPGFDRRPA